MATGSQQPAIVVTHDHGTCFVAQVRSHIVRVDQPIAAGGDDEGPTPLELLGVSLGSCVALYVHAFLEARGLDPAGLRVDVEQHSARNPSRVGHFTVRVALSAPVPEMYRAMLQRVVHSCPAHNTLEASTPVHVEFEIPAEAGVVA